MARIKVRNLALMGFMIIFLGWISWADARSTTNIAKEKDNAPDTGSPSGKFASFGPFSLDDAGHVAFEAGITPDLNATGTAASINQGIFIATKTPGVAYDPAKHLDKIVLNGDTAPGAGSFFSFDTLSVNVNQSTNKVQIAFWASVLRRDGITIDEGVYLYTAGALKKIAVTGDVALADADPVTGGNQPNMFGMLGTPVLNKKGQVAFWTSLTDIDGNDAGEGLFVYDSSVSPAALKLVTKGKAGTTGGDDTPNGATGSGTSGKFQQLAAPSLDDNSRVAFLGFYTNGGQSSHGMFLYTSSGGSYSSTGGVTIASMGMTTITSWGAGVASVDFPALNINVTADRMMFWVGDSLTSLNSTGLVINSGGTNTTIASTGSAQVIFTNLTSFGTSTNNQLTRLDLPSFNDARYAAFWGMNSVGSFGTTGLVLAWPPASGYVYNSYGTIAVYSQGFSLAAGNVLTNGTQNTFGDTINPISTFNAPILNNLKAVAFWAKINSSGTSEGLFLDEDAGPDFILDTVSKGSNSQVVAPRRVRRGTTITVTVKIKNQGTSGGLPNVTRAVFVDDDGNGIEKGDPVLTTSDGNSLNNGKSRIVKIRLRVPSLPGTNPHRVKVTADSSTGTTELNENNNTGTSAAIQIR